MPGSKDRSGPGWKDGTHWCIRQSQSWLKSNGDAGARKVRTAQIQQLGTLAIGEQAEVANAHETGGQDMQQEAT